MTLRGNGAVIRALQHLGGSGAENGEVRSIQAAGLANRSEGKCDTEWGWGWGRALQYS